MSAVAVLTAEQIEELIDRAVKKALRGPDSMSTDQAAEYAGVGRKTLTGWISSGRLPAGYRGRYRVIQRSDLDAFLAGERHTPPTPTEDPVIASLRGSKAR